MKGERTVPIQLRWCSDMIHLDLRPSCSAMSDLKGADILLGLPGLRELDATIECNQKRIFFNSSKTWILLEPVSTLKSRLKANPLRILSFAGGGEFIYATIVDCGWRVEDYEAHELDPDRRAIAKQIITNNILRHPNPQDVLNLKIPMLEHHHANLVLLTAPCQPFSQCVTHCTPKGLDDPRAEPLIHCSMIIRHGMRHRPDIMFLSEQVVAHKALKLKGVCEEQDRLIGADEHTFGYVTDNARQSGSPCSRTRRLATNICDVKSLVELPSVNPNSILQRGCKINRDIIPCIVASQNTHSIPKCFDPSVNSERQLNITEKEAAMGYPAGITNSSATSKKVSLRRREEIIGSALNYYQMRMLLIQISPAKLKRPIAIINAAPLMMGAVGDTLEHMFLPMTQNQTKEWCVQRMSEINFEMPKLRLTLRDPHMLPYQTRQRNTVQAGLVPSATKWVKKALKEGLIREAE